jgi:sarcosine oxidase
VTITGGLDLWPADAAIPQADYTGSLAAEGVEFELLDAAEIMRRWPQWRLADDVTGIWQAQGGIADPFAANHVHRQSAIARGARLLERTRVEAVSGSGGAYEVSAGGVTHMARSVTLTADAWTNALLANFDRRLPLTVTKEQVTYFQAANAAAFAPDRFPVWIWMDDPSFYGFPVYGEAGPKVAQDCGGRPVDPDRRTFEPDEAISGRVRTFLERRLPGALGQELYTKTCLYTLTPDRDFVVDRVPDAPSVVVGLGAAHGFKFASVLGRILVELALDGTSPSDGELDAFRIDRPLLLDADPPLAPLV